MFNLRSKEKLQAAVLILFVTAVAYAKITGPDAGYTNAPGDLGNCTSCHDTPFHDPNLERLACLPNQLANSLRDFARQYFVAVFRDPYKVVLDLKNRVAAVSVFHSAPLDVRRIFAAKADRLKPVVSTL